MLKACHLVEGQDAGELRSIEVRSCHIDSYCGRSAEGGVSVVSCNDYNAVHANLYACLRGEKTRSAVDGERKVWVIQAEGDKRVLSVWFISISCSDVENGRSRRSRLSNCP